MEKFCAKSKADIEITRKAVVLLNQLTFFQCTSINRFQVNLILYQLVLVNYEQVERYTEGLCWSSLYYFSGVPSWKWYYIFHYDCCIPLLLFFSFVIKPKLEHYIRFYPYHYGPFASDLRGLSQVKVKFEKGLPFKPFDQLMGVLPPRR